jgi:hypothetical protein
MILYALIAIMGVPILIVANAFWKSNRESGTESHGSETAAMIGVVMILFGIIGFSVMRLRMWLNES